MVSQLIRVGINTSVRKVDDGNGNLGQQELICYFKLLANRRCRERFLNRRSMLQAFREITLSVGEFPLHFEIMS